MRWKYRLTAPFLFLYRGLEAKGRFLVSVLWTSLGMATGIFVFALVTAGEIYEYQDTVDGVRLPPVDAIVCLAGGRGRIAVAGDLWYRYWELAQTPVPGLPKSPMPHETPILYFSGMGHHSNWNVVAKQVRRGVLGVLRPENVLIENESINTDENAQFVARYAKHRNWDRILLVTSRYHMRRAKMIFEQVFKATGISVRIETMSVYQEPFEPGEWREGVHGIRVTLIEYIKWLYYKTFWRAEQPKPIPSGNRFF